MKYLISIILVLSLSLQAFAELNIKESHERMLYPVVRVNGGGSGSVIFSEQPGPIMAKQKQKVEPFSTYVLTNWHVVAAAIKITKKWDSNQGKKVDVEKRDIIHVEQFIYKEMSEPVGTTKVEAEIVLYDEEEDLALVKLSSEEKFPWVVEFFPPEELPTLPVFSRTTAVGCSLSWPPVPSQGILTRKNVRIDSLPFHMSTAQIIYGNSGGAMFDDEGRFIGVPSRVPALGWGGSDPVVHMGLFIPVERVFAWLDREHYEFIYNPDISEAEGLQKREEMLKSEKVSNQTSD